MTAHLVRGTINIGKFSYVYTPLQIFSQFQATIQYVFVIDFFIVSA